MASHCQSPADSLEFVDMAALQKLDQKADDIDDLGAYGCRGRSENYNKTCKVAKFEKMMKFGT